MTTSLKRANQSEGDWGLKRLKINYSPENSYFQVLPPSGELMQRILRDLTFKELNTLLEVSKVFWGIVGGCDLPAKNSIKIYSLVEDASQSANIPPWAHFWGKFQTTVLIDSIEDGGWDIPDLMEELSILLSRESRDGELLFPKVNSLCVNFSMNKLFDSLKYLKESLASEKLSSISKLDLHYFISKKNRRYINNIHSELKKIINVMPKLKEITLSPSIYIDFKISSVAANLFSIYNNINGFKLGLSKELICCKIEFLDSFDNISYDEDFDITSKQMHRVRLIQKSFLKTMLGIMKFHDVKKVEDLYKNLNAQNTIFYSNYSPVLIHELVDELKNEEYQENLELFENLILYYEFDPMIDFKKLTVELTKSLSDFYNLKKIILKPMISFSNDVVQNAIYQTNHEHVVLALKNFSKEKDILLQMDYSIVSDNDEILSDQGPLKETKQDLVEACLSVTRKKLNSIVS